MITRSTATASDQVARARAEHPTVHLVGTEIGTGENHIVVGHLDAQERARRDNQTRRRWEGILPRLHSDFVMGTQRREGIEQLLQHVEFDRDGSARSGQGIKGAGGPSVHLLEAHERG